MPKGWRPRGVTPCLRSGAAAESARLLWCRNAREELPCIQGQGQWQRVPGCDSAEAAKRSYPTPEARGGGLQEQPHVQGAVAARAQEGLEEPSHVEGQEGQR